MKNIIRLIFLFSILLIYLGCNKPIICGKGFALTNSVLRISPFDVASNRYIYTDNFSTTIFKRDSLKIINQNGTENLNTSFKLNTDPINPLNRIYSIDIHDFFGDNDSDAFNAEKIKKVYLKYYYNVIDTVTITFKATSNKCSLERYEYAKIFYKGNLIKEIKDDPALVFDLKR
jgi:hypothetical protein